MRCNVQVRQQHLLPTRNHLHHLVNLSHSTMSLLQVTCNGYKLEELPEQACNCRRMAGDTNNCQRCKLRGGMLSFEATKTCARCRNSLYLADSACITAEGCPGGTVPTGLGTFGRVCLAPFTCFNGRIREGPNAGKACKCTSGCRACTWGPGGTECIACRNKRYLHEGECRMSCPATLTQYGISS